MTKEDIIEMLKCKKKLMESAGQVPVIHIDEILMLIDMDDKRKDNNYGS